MQVIRFRTYTAWMSRMAGCQLGLLQLITCIACGIYFIAECKTGAPMYWADCLAADRGVAREPWQLLFFHPTSCFPTRTRTQREEKKISFWSICLLNDPGEPQKQKPNPEPDESQRTVYSLLSFLLLHVSIGELTSRRVNETKSK